jgi:hypothetical protein
MNLDIFEMVVGISELVKEFINWKLLIFCKCQVDVKNIKMPIWSGGGNMKPCF